MLKHLHVQNFTVFANAAFDFSPGLNVIVGTNGTGKSHVLKLAYAVARSSHEARRTFALQTKAALQKDVAESLLGTFRPESLGRLARRPASKSRTEVAVDFVAAPDATIHFSFSAGSKTEVSLEGNVTRKFEVSGPVIIPAKELMAMFPGLTALTERYELALDLTYTDLARRLGAPPLKEKALEPVLPVLQQLQQIMGGTLRQEGGRFYLHRAEGEKLEMDLVAEGIRKFATLAQLLSNGGLHPGHTLFWDEPEANLNPALLRELASLLMLLARQGFQIILATHSLFLLKEFHILAHEQRATVRYFGLSAQPGEATQVSMHDNLELLPDIVALDAELDQSDRFQTVLDQEDAN